MKKLCYICCILSFVACAPGCSICTSSRIADYGRVYDCVQIKEDSPVWTVDGHGDWYYFNGERSTYTRRGAKIVRGLISSGAGGTYTRVPEAEVSPVVIEASLYGDSALIARELPDYAKPLTNKDAAWTDNPTPLGRILFTSGEDTKLTSDAYWAYPLAGLSFVAVDLPLTTINFLSFAVSMPFAQIGLGICNSVTSWFEESD